MAPLVVRCATVQLVYSSNTATAPTVAAIIGEAALWGFEGGPRVLARGSASFPYLSPLQCEGHTDASAPPHTVLAGEHDVNHFLFHVEQGLTERMWSRHGEAAL
ncbi:hypothetical protein [Oryza sativa Japonica Group]|uniref:Uncharacterized protein n=1 Tax=Oryza sativa subsp. japonica TaxID=39947 RepID=Q5QLE3_ORYSJ|nr:hypothetical protein [Oryza sativa Japonica Group]